MKYLLFIIISLLFLIDGHAQNNPCDNCYQVIMIIDNSGSIDNLEYDDMKTSVSQISEELIGRSQMLEIAIVQYYTQFQPGGINNHEFDITVSFTRDLQALKNFTRVNQYGDHLPGSLAEMRHNDVWDISGDLDVVSDDCSIKCFIFTDAVKEASTSYLINSDGAPNALPNYEEYNYLKSTYGMEITVYHVVDFFNSEINEEAGAAISSVGGNYMGVIDSNPGDPQGDGTLPRKYFPGSTFLLSENQIKSIANEIVTDTCTSRLIVPNVFSPNNDGMNDSFTIKKRNIAQMEVIIYNRWGSEVIRYDSMDYEWDGISQQGNEVAEATYFYVINAQGYDGKMHQENGSLTLFR